MSVSGIWTRAPLASRGCGRLTNEPGRERPPAPIRSGKVEVSAKGERRRSWLVGLLAGVAASAVGAGLAGLAGLAGSGEKRGLLLLYGAVHTASVLLMTAWARRADGGVTAPVEPDGTSGVARRGEPCAPAEATLDPWCADTEPALSVNVTLPP